MNQISVLLANNINVNQNPYTYLLHQHLNENKNIKVDHGFLKIIDLEKKYDLIHIQWPEEIFWRNGGASLENKNELIFCLKERKARGQKLVLTVHNLKPHINTDLHIELYRLTYELVDGCIHLAVPSKKLVLSEYKEQISPQMSHICIAHGNYEIYKEQTKNKFSTKGYVLALGAIRDKDEYLRLFKSAKILRKHNLKLVIAGENRQEDSFKINPIRRLIYKLIHWNVKIVDERLSNKRIDEFLQESKLVYIQRIKGLNSGVVYLALTYGKPVIGPNIGNIGYVIKESGNEVFNTSGEDSFESALVKTLSNYDTYSKNSLQYAKKELCWDDIATKHINFYRSILSLF